MFAQTYTQANVLTVSRINLVDPLPTAVMLKGEAVEDAAGIKLIPAYLDGKAVGSGVYECFTKISEGEFTVVDELDRYYSLKSNGRIKHIVDGSSTANTLKAGIYWIKIDFSAMTYTAVQVSMIEYYAASWADNSMSTVYKTLTYKGKGVWELLDYDNEISVNSSNDTRHRFNMTTADGNKWFLGTTSSLGSSYTTDYLRVYIYTFNDNDKDWNKTYNFLVSDCGRDFDCYLYLNGDNKAGGFWHEYIFK